MKRLCSLVLLLVVNLVAAAAENENPALGLKPVVLHPGQINNVVLTPGIVTSLRLLGNRKVDRILPGAKIFAIKLDEELGRIDLVPIAHSGYTNLIITIDGTDYVFVVQIEQEPAHAVYTRTYTFADEKQVEFSADLARLGSAPKLKPSDIDPAALAKIIEKARVDSVYRKTQPDLRQVSVSKPYAWNNCVVHLLEVDAFLDQDLLMVKVQWVNTTGTGIYLNSRQLGLTIAGKPIRILTSMQDSPDSWVLPGQLDTIWLVVQGERLGYQNEWQLRFPAEARVLPH